MISLELAAFIAQEALTGPYRQIMPMTSGKFQEWLWKLDINFMDWQTLHYLWLNGVLNPVGVSKRAIDETPGLDRTRFAEVALIDGDYIYADLGARTIDLPLDVGRRDFSGLADALWWHPFQLYEFYGIEWDIHQNWSLDTYLADADDGSIEGTNDHRARGRKRLSARASEPAHDEFRKLLGLLVAVEPCVHGYIHGSFQYSMDQSIEGYDQWCESRLGEDLIERVGLTLDAAIAWHEQLSTRAHLNDPLRGIRTLVSQINPKRRAKAEGCVLRSNLMYSQAETLRRYLEWTNDLQLFEEDDYQMRERHQQFKEDAFGNKRVMDGQRAVRRRVNRYYGVDHAERVAILLEGPTEVAFFECAAEEWGIDLERRGFVLYDLSGKDRLGRDQIILQQLEVLKRHEIFAYAALDNDGGGDHLRSLKKKAVEGLLSAGYTLWNPDFESSNFSVEELALAATTLAIENEIDVEFSADEIRESMRKTGMPAGRVVEDLAKRRHVYISKGKDWGRALAKLACAEEVDVPEEIRNEKGERPALSILAMLIRGYDADYGISAEHTISKHRGGS